MPWHGLGTKLENRPHRRGGYQSSTPRGGTFVKKPLYVAMSTVRWPANMRSCEKIDGMAANKGRYLEQSSTNTRCCRTPRHLRFSIRLSRPARLSTKLLARSEMAREVWVMARVTSDQEIRSGTFLQILLLTNRHDGKGAVCVKFTPVRVVCSNTLNQAMEGGATLRVAHTMSMKDRLETLRGNQFVSMIV